jgi:DNA-binding NarL/FixJ family response regulator
MQGSAAKNGSIRVLLADDDERFLESLRPLIDHQPGLAVVGAAHDGLAAIELADKVRPDAIVIDLHMPLLDGVSAVARLRGEYPALCMIALTGDADPGLHEAVMEAGADAVLLKDEFVDRLLARLVNARIRG